MSAYDIFDEMTDDDGLLLLVTIACLRWWDFHVAGVLSKLLKLVSRTPGDRQTKKKLHHFPDQTKRLDEECHAHTKPNAEVTPSHILNAKCNAHRSQHCTSCFEGVSCEEC